MASSLFLAWESHKSTLSDVILDKKVVTSMLVAMNIWHIIFVSIAARLTGIYTFTEFA
jgi:hypothetical protein